MREMIIRVLAVFGRRDRALDEELRSHVEMATEENRRRGMSDEAARTAALRSFGGVTQVRERFREREGLPLVENLRRDVGYALRQMRKSPGFAAVVIATLALGIGAATAMFTLVYSTLLRSLPYPQAESIVAVHDVRLTGQSTAGLVSGPRFYDLRARNHTLASVSFFFFDHVTLISGTKLPEAVEAVGADAALWSVYGVRPVLGRTFDAADDAPNAPDAVVLSYAGWQRLFDGDAGVVGRQVTLNQKAATIVGVMPPNFQMPGDVDLCRPAHFDAAQWRSYRGEGVRFLNVVARLKPGIAMVQARDDLARIGEQLQREHPQSDGMWQFSSETLRDARYGSMRATLLALLTASALLLAIACINVANLLLSRGTARQREVAVRRALGASAARLTAQFLTESTLLAFIGGGAGVAAAIALVRWGATRLPGRLGTPGTIEMHWPVLGFAFGLSVATGIAFGLAPALESRKTAVHPGLSRGSERQGGPAGHALRSGLVSVQVGLSLILLVGATLLSESLWHLLRNPLGFNPDHVLTFSLNVPWNSKPDWTRNFYAEVQQRVESLPGVSAVGQIDALPMVDWHLRSTFDADWLPRIADQPAINAESRSIGGNFTEALGVPLLAGRSFTAQDDQATVPPVLVNEELVRRYLHGSNPIGRHLLANGHENEIVGVVADVRGTSGSIAQPPGPEVYWPADGAGHSETQRSFVVRSQTPPARLIRALREQIHDVDPQQAIGKTGTMDQLLDEVVAEPRLNMAVVIFFAGIALLLACVGTYGVVAYSAAQRTQEIGVRMAVGATRAQVAVLFVRRAMVSALLGLGGGLFLSLMLMHWLQGELYDVQPNDAAAYAVAIAVLLLPVVTATLHPAICAARVDPMRALRSE